MEHKSPKPRQLFVESLEDRTVPSILFHQGVAVTLSNHNPGQAAGAVMTSPKVELVFWGSDWNTGSNPSLRTNVTNAASYIMSGAYIGALGQYGVGIGVVAGSVTITGSSPGKNFTDAQVRTMLSGNIGGNIPYSNSFLYLVIAQPGSTDPAEGLLGNHSVATALGGRVYYGWTENVGGTGAMDDITTVLSHEYAEAVTDPDGSAFQVEPRNQIVNGVINWNEICDGEAQNYTFRVNNYLLQSYYSQRDNAYVVPNGSTNDFLVSTTGVLTLQGFFGGHNNIYVNRVNNGVYAELNSSTAQFDPGAISAIQVNSGNGNANTIGIWGTPVPVTVSSGGTAGISVGVQGSLGNILAPVNVTGNPNTTDLFVDDSADSFGDRQVTLSDTSLTISPITVINYSPTAIRSLTLEGGPGSSGTNVYHILNTPAGQTTLRTRGSHDFVQIHADQGPVAVGGFANNSIVVGNAGSLGGIRAAVTVANIGGLTAATLTVDDRADTFADRLIKVTDTALTVEQPGLVTINYSAITSLVYEGGPGSSGANVYHILNTPAGQTTLRTRGSQDFVQIHANQGPVAVGGFANNSIVVGNAGSLGGIRAAVTVANIGGLTAAMLTVDDRADTFADRLVKVTDTALTVEQPGLVTINYSAITSLVYEGGPGSSGTNTYHVLNTPPAQTTIRTRGSHDFVQIHANQGPVAVGGFANNSIVVGNAGSLGGIQAAVTVANIGGLTAATLTVDDSADTFADRLVTLTSTALTIEQPGLVTINYSAVTSLTYLGGPGSSGSNVFAVESTAAGTSTSLDGGSKGTNTLDYTNYAGNVLVNLPLGVATGFSSIANIQNVKGASGGPPGSYNVLIGFGGNVLTGGTDRRNILVAGGASTLNGGNLDDLLIGGSTTYDTEAGLVSWQAIAAYWAGPDDYLTRVANLTSGNGVPLLDATTVSGNGGGNVMSGNGALALIYSDGLDNVTGFDPNSVVVPIMP